MYSLEYIGNILALMRPCCLWIRKNFCFEILIVLIHKLITIKEHHAILGNDNYSAKKVNFVFGNIFLLKNNRLAYHAPWTAPLGTQSSMATHSSRAVGKQGLAWALASSSGARRNVLSWVSSGIHQLQITFTVLTHSLLIGKILN